VTDQEQLTWEARLGRPAALAAFAAGALQLAGSIVFQSMLDNREGIEPLPDYLLSVNESPGTLVVQAALQAGAALCMIFVFYYLFRASFHRVPPVPRWMVYLIVVGPAVYAISQLLGAVDRVDTAEIFADRDYSFPDAEADSNLDQCPAMRGELGTDCAEELLLDNQNALLSGLGLAGGLTVAFMFISLPLRARRAGLLSPFMGILGVITGALLVLQVLQLLPVGPLGVIQIFWLGAVGALFLGSWPGGRGPAWETGRADPWPSAAERRGLVSPPEQQADEEPAPPEPEPAPQRPSSRKRKRKR
jgi:hypothetical protein